jgi:hypothetical protein
MRCHPAMGRRPNLYIVGVFSELNSESAGYFDCAIRQLNRIRSWI